MRQGVHTAWNLQRIVAELDKRINDSWRDEKLRQLERVCTGLEPANKMVGRASLSLLSLGLEYSRRATRATLSDNVLDERGIAIASAYSLRGWEFALIQLGSRFKTRNDARSGFDELAITIAQTLSIGWTNFHRVGEEMVSSVLKGHFFAAYPPYRNCAAWLITKLFADWRGLRVTNWPAHQYPAPIYDALLSNWREPDENKLTDLLIAACDWHTHECWKWSDNPEDHGDFTLDPYFAWPIEIHMILRMRENLGLPNPIFEHPLMQTALGEFRPPLRIFTDSLLDAVTSKVVETYPKLADQLSLLTAR
ncbi:MAG: hypothetical protein HC814_00035 [Rhodobacteraceae bacterium]|nr:hypothetical protein [Paracoccaceae bacterium]